MRPGPGTRLALYGLVLLFAWLCVWVVLATVAGRAGWVRIRPDQVAVKSDHVRGTARVLTTPGVALVLPWFQEVTLFERAPARLRLRSGGDPELDLAPLTVRAADGTRFSFEDLTLVHRIEPAAAGRVLGDSGASADGRSRLVRALARGVLQDELGRHAAEEIARGEVLDAARARARERLNAALAPHGIVVDELPAAMPRFDPAYEEQLLRRRVAEQKIELVRAQRRRLVSEVEHRRVRVRREKESEREVLAGELAARRLRTERDAIRSRREADLAHLKRVEDARVDRLEMEARAGALRARYAGEAESFSELVRAVGAGGERSVREAWIRTLAKIDIELVPGEPAVSRAPSPTGSTR